MKRLFTIVIMCIGCFMAANAQTTFTQRIQQVKMGEGKVTVSHDAAIDELVNGPKVATTPLEPTQRQESAGHLATQPKGAEAATTSSYTTPTTATAGTTDTDDPGILPVDTRKKVMLNTVKVPGYRVQAFAGGNSRQDRIKAEQTANTIKRNYPEVPVYTHFYSPRWICRVGNYRTLEEAEEMLHNLKKLGFKSATIVKGKITVKN